MRCKHVTLLWIVFTTISTISSAQDRDELESVEKNPWFMPNIHHVNYCINIDEKGFGATLQQSRSAVARAFAYWLEEFALAQPDSIFGYIYPRVRLGTQSFAEVACGNDVDVEFQFGELTPEQKQLVGRSDNLIGATVQAQYDRVSMKGRGFIYLSPEHGPGSISDQLVVKNRWTAANGMLLELALIHEVGHIFGIRNTTDTQSLASREFLYRLLQPGFGRGVERVNYIPHQLFLADSFTTERCEEYDENKEINELLGIEGGWPCIRIESDRLLEINFYKSRGPHLEWFKVGRYEANRGWYGDAYKLKIDLVIPAEQQAIVKYSSKEPGPMYMVPGIFWYGRYFPVAGEPRHMWLTHDLLETNISGITEKGVLRFEAFRNIKWTWPWRELEMPTNIEKVDTSSSEVLHDKP